ncbi:MAG: hypothetical protein EOP06_02795 [Proteobacteria bacterium]|nr:MAG: hypothetical protein EOP06_02795 [Pseudomonadota bacterium]
MVLVLFQAETDADDTMSLVVALSEPSPTVSELSGMHEDEAKALFTISLTQKANAMAADYDAMAKLIVSR